MVDIAMYIKKEQQIRAMDIPENINNTLFLLLIARPKKDEIIVIRPIGIEYVYKCTDPVTINTKIVAVTSADIPVTNGLLTTNAFPFVNITT